MAVDVHVSYLSLRCRQTLHAKLTSIVSAAASPFPAPCGPRLLCPSFPAERRPTGLYPPNDLCHKIVLTPSSRIFTQKEVELARSRMPTEAKFFTGLFKWKDIKRWHTTWHVWLCKTLCSRAPTVFIRLLTCDQSPSSSLSCLSGASLEDQVSPLSCCLVGTQNDLQVPVIFWVKSYNVKGHPPSFSVPQINIIPLGVSSPPSM
jgi:hypothetical protein